MIKRVFVFSLLFLIVGCVSVYYLIPWNALLQNRAESYLVQRGFENIKFSIDKVGLHSANLANIQVGVQNPLILQNVKIEYSPLELVSGTLKEIELTGLDISIKQTEDSWSIAGLDSLRGKRKSGDASLSLPDVVDLLPFSKVSIKNSFLRFEGSAVQASLPFSLTLLKGLETRLELTVNATDIFSAASDASLGIITFRAQPDEFKKWRGSWGMESIALSGDYGVPVLSGIGDISYVDKTIAATGEIFSKDLSYKGAFQLDIDTENSAKNALIIKNVSFPFKGGVVSSANITVPFLRTKNFTIPVKVHKVSLDQLMQTLTKNRVTATGTVSGNMPVIVRPDGSYTLGKGALKADDKGTLQISSDIIPGSTDQVDLVRKIMQNLHYSLFNAAVETSADKGMFVRLSVEGNNPDIYNGRTVKLNINLTGDVLDFIQKNAMLFTKPEQLLKQELQ